MKAKLKKHKYEFSLTLSSEALTLSISPLNHFISGLLSQSILTHLSFNETQPCHRSTQTQWVTFLKCRNRWKWVIWSQPIGRIWRSWRNHLKQKNCQQLELKSGKWGLRKTLHHSRYDVWRTIRIHYKIKKIIRC